MKTALLTAFVFLTAGIIDASATSADEAEWVKFAEKANGDLYFYDPTRVEITGSIRRVWNGIQYKTSLMGASSFLTLMEIDCAKRTEKTLQRTFFSDKNWKTPAMQTDTSESAEIRIETGSMMESLADIVCEL